MTDMFLPDSYSKITRSTVVVPAPDDVGGLYDPTTGRTVIPAVVEMTVRWDYDTPRGNRQHRDVTVSGPRLLKSGDTGRTISIWGWEEPVVEGRDGIQHRPQWLTDLIAAHLPAVLDLKAGS